MPQKEKATNFSALCCIESQGKSVVPWKFSSNHSSDMRYAQKSVKFSDKTEFHMAFSFPRIPAVQSQTIHLLIFKTKLKQNLFHIHIIYVSLSLKGPMLFACKTLSQNLWIDSAYFFILEIITMLCHYLSQNVRL